MPRLTFVQERLNLDNLNLDRKSYKSRKTRDEKRLKAVFSYIQTKTCRSRVLLSYFGEDIHEDCGHCDYCIRKNRIKGDFKIKEKILNRINQLGSLNSEISILKKEIGEYELIQIQEALRELIDEEKIRIEGTKFLIN